MPEAALGDALRRVIDPRRVRDRPIDRLARSADASIYRLIPRVVVQPRGLDEMRALLAFAAQSGHALTFRAGGTSLSGQAVTDDVLVELALHWRGYAVLDGGARVWSQPGVQGGLINRALAPHGRRLGPDPASIDAAMLGGIIANNSSGMCCGVAQNSYHTLESLAVLLADGTLVDTSRGDADEVLRAARPDVHAGLLALRDAVRGDTALAARIRHKTATKNTMGYSVQALLDHEAPAQILAHLMVGSQGTLGFVSEVTLRTVPEPPLRATALLYFDELARAGAAVGPLAEAGAAALEIMDAASLRSQAGERTLPFPIDDRMAALLVEMRGDAPAELDARLADASRALAPFALLEPAAFTQDAAERERHWRLRKGLFPAVGGMRAPGTAVVIEDVTVPVTRLAEGIVDLRALFDVHGFSDSIVFGHAKDGNLHFVFAKDFSRKDVVERYAAFMDGLADLIVGKYDGALKAEHASGRNMAPFVRREWGEAAYDVMRRIKALLDPQGVLNPGVLLNDDPQVHLRNLKALPPISPLADRCIECGFCEPRCPSRHLTLTPRQRIVATREMTRLGALDTPEARAWRASLLDDFAYEGDATCARDGMCETSCPVRINTGDLVKEMAEHAHSNAAHAVARALAERFALVASGARSGLRLAALLRHVPFGRTLLGLLTRALHAVAPEVVPAIRPETVLPSAAPPLTRTSPIRGTPAGEVVYFPSCLTRIFGTLPGETSAPMAHALPDLLRAAGIAACAPQGLAGLCCGMPFGSKAYKGAADHCGSRTFEALWKASDGGRLTVMTDASPCAGTLSATASRILAEDGRSLRVRDFPAWWAREALPHRAPPGRRVAAAVLHPTCTLMKMGGLPDLMTVTRACAERVILPAAAECCGFAGDRGFLVPELTASATAPEAAEVAATAPDGARFVSTCRTCEIGLSRHTGREYASLVHLVRETLDA